MTTIFVSSTFQDMQYERDAIQKIVLPKLNAIAHEYGQSISFCDLRWGINTEELNENETNYKVLNVCLDEVKKSDNPMVVLLGNRYGWIPPTELMKKIATEKKLYLENYEISATALEIEYGSFLLNKNTLFYFRHSFEDTTIKTASSEDRHHKEKMEYLKNKISNNPNCKTKQYNVDFIKNTSDDISNFSDMLYEDLLEILLPKWQSFANRTPLEKESFIHWQYVFEKKALFMARKELSEKYIHQIKTGKHLVYVKGDSGTGKSTLFSLIASNLIEDGYRVIPIVSGLTTKVTTSLDVLKYEVLSIENLLHNNLNPSSTNPTSANEWIQRLENICKLYSETQTERLIIMFDAIDQLIPDEDREKLIFLPKSNYSNISFFLTSLPEIKNYSEQSDILQNMTITDREMVLNGILSRNHKELSDTVIKAVISKNGNPLYLDMLLQRLLLMNREDFEEIREKGGNIYAITAKQLEIIDTLPNSLEKMCVTTFKEAQKIINPILVEKVSQYISLSRYGLRDTDLSLLTSSSWNYLEFSLLTHLLSDSFLKREDGRYDFMHKCIRKGILSTINDEKTLHRDIFFMFYSQNNEDPVKTSEIIYHGILSEENELTLSLITETFNINNDYIDNVAENIYYLCINNSTEKVCSFLKHSFKECIDPIFFVFFQDKLSPLFKNNIYDANEYVKLVKTIKSIIDSLPLPDNSSIVNILNIYANAIRFCLLIHNSELSVILLKDLYKYIELLRPTFINNWYEKWICYFFYYGKGASDAPDWLDYLIKIADQKLEDKIDTRIPLEQLGPFFGCLGEIYSHRGEYAKVLEIYTKDYSIRKKIYEENPTPVNMFQLAGAYHNLGNIYMRFDLYKSRFYYEQSLSLTQNSNLIGQLSPDTYYTLFNLSIIYHKLGSLNKDELLLNKVYNNAWECIDFGRKYFKKTMSCDYLDKQLFIFLSLSIKDLTENNIVLNNGLIFDFQKRAEKILIEDSKIIIKDDTLENRDMIFRLYSGFYSVSKNLSYSYHPLREWINLLYHDNIIKPLIESLDEISKKDHYSRGLSYLKISFFLEKWGDIIKDDDIYISALDFCKKSSEEFDYLEDINIESKYKLLGQSALREGYCSYKIRQIGYAVMRTQDALALFKNSAKSGNNLDEIQQFIVKAQIQLNTFTGSSINSTQNSNTSSNLSALKTENKTTNSEQKNKETFDIYSGEMRNGIRHGIGTSEWCDGKGKYQGRWVNNLKEGYGECIFPNGVTYYGKWKKGKPNGLGVKHFPDGKTVSGLWNNGELERKTPFFLAFLALLRFKHYGIARKQ